MYQKITVLLCKINYQFDIATTLMNIIVDVIRHTMKSLYERVLLLFISLTQDVSLFSKIWWRGNGTSGVGEVILADIEAADWREIIAIVEKSDAGFKLYPIKEYLQEKIAQCLRHGDWERQNRFLRRD